MMHDPMVYRDIAEQHLAELRAEATVRRQLPHGVPGWRRFAGNAMVAAGRRLLAESPPTQRAMRAAGDCGE